jgi:hypothetical protein
LKLGPTPVTQNIDGFWWPYSKNFFTEASDLVENFPDELGRIVRLIFSAPDWDDEPRVPPARWLETKYFRIKVGSFPGDDTNLLILRTDRGTRLVLLVVPSELNRVEASHLVSQVTHGRAPGVGVEEYAVRGIDPLAGWADDGGVSPL